MTLERVYSGKVRDIYDAGDGLLLMVASDRISAFDRVFAEPVPDKGRVLTAMTAFWSGELAELAPTHLVTVDPASFPREAAEIADLTGRAMLVRRAEMLPVELIVRGYLSGSAWKEYQRSGTVHGVEIAPGLEESSALERPMFTPSTKATEGHDINISYEQCEELLGADVAARAREICLAAYALGAAHARGRGIIIADTKFELGVINGELAICDEILTPDSSRFWAADAWQPGTTAPSFDKQPVRDWAESTGWDKRSAPPPMPAEVIAATRDRYVSAYEQISGLSFSQWWGVSEASQR